MAGWESGVDTCNGLRLEPSDARDIEIMQKTANDLSVVNFNDNPEGQVSANVGSLCSDRTSGNLYQKLSGSSNTGWSSPINKQMVYYISDTIDFTQTGLVDLFTISTGGDFVPIFIGNTMDTVTNFLASAEADIGYNAPTYDNVFDAWQELCSNSASFYYQSSQIPGPIIPAGSNIKMNITLAEDADVATGKFFMMGFTL